MQKEVKDKILIIPRIYTGKPRTTGAGYKGMLHQPDPDKKPDMLEGIKAIRSLHKDAIEQTGLTCADEMLYPENHRYLSDLLSYVAVGARSVENQEHRLVSSGLDIPVGMKNPTSGDLSIMLNSIKAAQGDHTFLYRGWEVESKGNELAHAILRGSVSKHGNNHANYHYEDLRKLHDAYCTGNYKNPAVIVDTNHSNSSKKYLEQVISLLNKAGFLQSMRGNNGGYKLAKKPKEYTAGDILRVTEGSLAPISCLQNTPNRCERRDKCTTISFWEKYYQIVTDYVDSVTLNDLAENVKSMIGNDYNI